MSELNIPLIRKLQARLLDESRREAFNMADWITHNPYPLGTTDPAENERVHACGTSACIAGHVVLMLPEYHVLDDQTQKRIIVRNRRGTEVVVMWAAQRALGLTLKQTDQLFLMLQDPTLKGEIVPASTVTAAQAVAALDNMIAHGEPKWGEVLRG